MFVENVILCALAGASARLPIAGRCRPSAATRPSLEDRGGDGRTSAAGSAPAWAPEARSGAGEHGGLDLVDVALEPGHDGRVAVHHVIQDRPAVRQQGGQDGPADDAGQVSWAAGADAAGRGQFLACS
jgi:hypothetical protein